MAALFRTQSKLPRVQEANERRVDPKNRYKRTSSNLLCMYECSTKPGEACIWMQRRPSRRRSARARGSEESGGGSAAARLRRRNAGCAPRNTALLQCQLQLCENRIAEHALRCWRRARGCVRLCRDALHQVLPRAKPFQNPSFRESRAVFLSLPTRTIQPSSIASTSPPPSPPPSSSSSSLPPSPSPPPPK